MAASGRGGGCLRSVLIGCAMVLVLGVVAVVGVVTNLDLIQQSDWYRSISSKAASARTEFRRSLEIRAALLARYPAEEIGVNLGFARTGGTTVRTLAVSIAGPKFDLPESLEARQEVARGIARDVARLHPEIQRFDRVVVRIVRRLGAASVSTSADEFVFPVAELIDGSGAGDASTGAAANDAGAPVPEAGR